MSPTSLIPIFLVAVSAAVSADTLTLTDGRKLSGKVIEETADGVLFETQVSASIVDTKMISKDEIDKIERKSPEDKAWTALASLKPGPNSLTSAAYDNIIVTRLEAHLRQFPQSTHKGEIEGMIEAFRQEKARVEAGDVKLGGRWIIAEEVEKNGAEIESCQIFEAMKDSLRQRDFSTALNTFETLEKKYPGTSVFPDALDLARQALTAFRGDLELRAAALKRYQEKWKQSYENNTLADQKQQLDYYANQEKEKALSTLAKAKEAGLKWVPIIERNEDSLVELQKLVPTEMQRLIALDSTKMRDALAKLGEAEAKLADNDFESASALVTEAKALWPALDRATRLLAEIPALKEKAVKVAMATPVATPTPAATPAADEEKTKASVASAPASEAAPEKKPFYMTTMGAVAIAAGALVLVGGLSLLGKLRGNKPTVGE